MAEHNLKNLIDTINTNIKNFRREIAIMKGLSEGAKNEEALNLSIASMDREITFVVHSVDILLRHLVAISEQQKTILDKAVEKTEDLPEDIKDEITGKDE